MKTETFWAVLIKLIVGSSFYILTRLIMKSCSEPSYSFDYAVAADKYTNKNCPLGETAFSKGVFVMTVGWASMAPALIWFVIFRKKKALDTSYGRKAILTVAVPSSVDMVSTALNTYGSQYISLSLAFIFKGGRVVFSAILTMTLLKRRLYMHHWTSVFLCIVGLIVAASSQLFTEPSSVFGVAMVLGAELFKALRIVIEEKLMKCDSFEPTFIVGIEGLYGAFVFGITLIVVWLGIPGYEAGSFENLPDTFYRIAHSERLIALFCIFPIVTCIVSIVSAVVTRNLSAVHNGLISVIRVGLLWMCELFFYYTFMGSTFGMQMGEPWNRYSVLKLIGFGIVLFSTLLYDEDIKLKWLFKYDHTGVMRTMKDDTREDREAPVANT